MALNLIVLGTKAALGEVLLTITYIHFHSLNRTIMSQLDKAFTSLDIVKEISLEEYLYQVNAIAVMSLTYETGVHVSSLKL
jgi:hypothetical protein